jgi:hypothetical protein
MRGFFGGFTLRGGEGEFEVRNSNDGVDDTFDTRML